MPHKKHITKPPARAKTKTSRSSTRKLSKPVRANIRLSKKQEAFLKAQALQKAGVYQPKKKLNIKTFTAGQARHVDRQMHKAMEHGAFINGKVVRPFQRTMRGYKMTKDFTATKKKATRKIPGALKTHTGAVIPRELGKNYKVLKDGTLTYTAKRNGKNVTIYSGQLTANQTLALMHQLEKGTFKMPKGMHGRIMMFNAYTPNGMRGFTDAEGLANQLSKYDDKLLSFINKYPTFAPITMEFWKEKD